MIEYREERTLDGGFVLVPVSSTREPPCIHLGHVEPVGEDHFRCTECGLNFDAQTAALLAEMAAAR